MKIYKKELIYNVPAHRGLVKITDHVREALKESEIKEGLALVNTMSITASVFINDNEQGLHHDWEKWLEKLAPEFPKEQYEHNIKENNAHSHLKRAIMGRECVCAITDGKLDFGGFEDIFYYELDGQRDKKVLVKIIGE